jgi:hypothetical protein
MTRHQIKTATLEQLTDELAAAGWDSTQTNIRDAREAVERLAAEHPRVWDAREAKTTQSSEVLSGKPIGNQ